MERTVAALRQKRELCSIVDLYGDRNANGRNDISTLIRRGWGIEKHDEDHGLGHHVHYLLRADPGMRGVQLELIAH